jgi:hypothetical protein
LFLCFAETRKPGIYIIIKTYRRGAKTQRKEIAVSTLSSSKRRWKKEVLLRRTAIFAILTLIDKKRYIRGAG